MLHENAALAQLLMFLIDIDRKLAKIQRFLATLLAQSKIQRVHAKEGDEGHSTINVITERLNQLCSLRFDNIRLLSIAGVQGEADELLRVIVHRLPLRLRSLNHLQADI